jgi:hypothetical protein
MAGRGAQSSICFLICRETTTNQNYHALRTNVNSNLQPKLSAGVCVSLCASVAK